MGKIVGVKRTARAALDNRAALAEALRGVLPSAGLVLEVGSGTGEHAVFLAAAFPALTWQPSDPDPEARASILAWSAEAGLENLLAPLELDLLAPAWTARRADALLCVNVLHVSPPACAGALLEGAARVLAGGPLVVYGPFTRGGARPAGRLSRIDRKLRAHDAALGVRDEDALVTAARGRGLLLERALDMPEEGDRLLVFRSASAVAR
jgi:SAM-dependent methyltransferase